MTKNFSNVLNMNNWGLNSVYIQTKHCVSTRMGALNFEYFFIYRTIINNN